MSKRLDRIKEEIAAIIPPTLFFFAALHIIAFVRALMLKDTGIPLETTASVTIAALILGKAVVIADLLPFINRYPHKPLIYNAVWKTLIYALIAMFFHYLERLIDFWREVGDVLAAHEKLLAEIVWPHFWTIQILLIILVLTYCMVRELVRVLGKGAFIRMVFGPLPSKSQ